MSGLLFSRPTLFAAVLVLVAGCAAHAQAATKPKYPAVCAKGVRIYNDRTELPAKRDSLAMPDGPPIRVTNPEEEEAAERMIRERAGSVGATSVLFATETVEEGDGRRTRRSVSAFFVPADSARAQNACKA